MFRANFQRTGVYNITEVRPLNKLKWQSQKFPEISTRCLGLAVADGIVCVGSKDRNLYGLDANNGQQLWRYQLQEKIFASPIIYEGTFYINSVQYNNTGTNQYHQYLRAIDIQSGQLKWQFKLEFQPLSLIYSSISSSPVISEGVIFIGGTDGILYGIDVGSGELVWSFKTTKNMPLTPPALKDEIIYVASGDGYLYAIETSTRQQKWQYEIGGLNPFIQSFPAIANRAVYIVGGDNILHALDLETGNPLWTFKGGNLSLSAPLITEKAIYTGDFNSSLLALDIETGETLSMFQTEEMKYLSNPVLAGNTIYIGGQGFLQALDLDTRQELWRFTPPLPKDLISISQFWIKKLGKQILTKLTKARFNTEKFSTPIIYEDRVYIGCRNGYIYALGI